MKRYWLFQYDTYYPQGGMNDFRASFDTAEECFELARDSCFDFTDVIDITTGTSINP